MLRMRNQKLLAAMKKSFSNARRRTQGKSLSDHSSPICDANDVVKAMLAMLFVLEDLAKDELQAKPSTPLWKADGTESRTLFLE